MPLMERLAAMRTQMIVDTVMTSPAASFARAPGTQRPKCPECGERLLSRGPSERRLLTTRGQESRLRRSYAHCPACGLELFPLDEELGLLPQRCTPRLVEQIARL